MTDVVSDTSKAHSRSGDNLTGDLLVEEIKDVIPLDEQADAYPKICVPDMLHSVLFGQPDKNTWLHTYAILDAAKVFGLDAAIASSGLDHRCLFKGQAQEDLGAVAPWIVALRDDATFTRHLFSHAKTKELPWFYWALQPGLYLRSAASIDDVRKHFRRFTRVPDENGKWFYLRFWEPRWISTLLRDMNKDDRTDFFGPTVRIIAPGAGGDWEILSLAPPDQTEPRVAVS